MKQLLFLGVVAFAMNGIGQEVVHPLMTNPSLYTPEVTKLRTGHSLDSTFIYSTSPLSISDVWDDFSQNKFVAYPPAYTDPNVTSQWFYYLMDAGNTIPEPDTVVFCDTSKAKHDTISVVSGLPTTFTTYFTPHSIWVNDLDNYPINGQTINLYDECYVLIDSVVDGVPDPTQDTIWYTNEPTHIQDSIHLFFVNLNNPGKIWLDNSACHNYRYAVDPWSLGMVTFDGVDSTGRPYEFGNPSAQGPADVLTSKPVNMAGTTNVFLQFLYQPKGHGNMPEDEDSLIVDFWQVDSARWYPWWNATPPYIENLWDTAFIAVPPVFLKDGFKFRVRNYASLSGALDHWHLDYVQLYENPLLEPQPYKDLAISYPLNSLLKDYTAVPWDHYQNYSVPNDLMIDTNYLAVYNSDDTPTQVGSDMFLEISYNGTVQGTYNLPNPGAIPPWTSNWELGMNQFPFFVSTNHTYSAPANDTMAAFDVKINVAADVAASNVYTVNDTSYMKQEFKNYYAYDDGSAEVAYQLQGTNALLAYEFNAYEADTLTGILIHFVPTVEDLSNKVLLLTVWDDNNGQPGDILYKDDFFAPHYPEYGASKNEFKYYTFANPDYPSVIKVPKKFYVGWEQIESKSFSLGMDRNIVNNSKIQFNVGGSWITSSQEGSLMIRPVFSTNIDHTLDLTENSESGETIVMFPNPASEHLSFSGQMEGNTVSIYDISGRLVLQQALNTRIDISFLQKGVYVVNITDNSGVPLFTEKLIKE
ncbi:MAG: T9SS type A sorting domain-containing protein [Crocinitomicaceae bacterium]